MYDSTLGPAATNVPSAFVGRGAGATSGGALQGDVLVSADNMSMPGFDVNSAGRVTIAGTVVADDMRIPSAADLSAPAASLAEEIRLAAFDRLSDGAISDTNFKRADGAVPAAKFDSVLGTDRGGTGRSNVPVSALPGMPAGELHLINAGDAGAPAMTTWGPVALRGTGAGESLELAVVGGGAVRLYPDAATLLAGGQHHVLSATSAIGAPPSSLPNALIQVSYSAVGEPVGVATPGAAANQGGSADDVRPTAGTGAGAAFGILGGSIAFERLSYSNARYRVAAAAGGASPLSNVHVAAYGAAGSQAAGRPRAPFEVVTGRSALPYDRSLPLASRAADQGLLRSDKLPASPGTTEWTYGISNAPSWKHHAFRAVAEDRRGNLSRTAELVWSTQGPSSTTSAVPSASQVPYYAGDLAVGFGATVAPGPAVGAASVFGGASANARTARAGLLIASDEQGLTVPGFCNSVGPRMPAVPGGLRRANADDPAAGPELAWAFYETLLSNAAAFDAAAPAVPAGAASDAAPTPLVFSTKNHLAWDPSGGQGGTGAWTAANNVFSRAYMPFVVIGDAYSNLRLHLYDAGVKIVNPDAKSAVRALTTSQVTMEYTLDDDMRSVTARVFAVGAGETAAGRGPLTDAGRAAATGFPLAFLKGQHQATFSNLPHSTFHLLELVLDAPGAVIKQDVSFSTADGASPTLALSGKSVSAAGAVRVSWAAGDSNDGGIKGVYAFSGSNAPATTPQALSDRMASAEARYMLSSGAPAAPRTGGSPLAISSAGPVTFSNASQAPHISHYVQVVVEDASALFATEAVPAAGGVAAAAASNKFSAADHGAEVPYPMSNRSVASVVTEDFPVRHAVELRGLAFQGDTATNTAFLVGLSEKAAAALLRAPGTGLPLPSEAASSNVWGLVAAKSNAFSLAIQKTSAPAAPKTQ